MKVTVVTGSASSGSNVDLERDVQLAIAGPDAVSELLSALDDSTLADLNGGREVPESAIENFRLLMAMDDESLDALTSLTGTDVIELKSIAGDGRTQVDGVVTQLRDTAERMFEDSGASDLAVAVEEGLVTVRPIMATAGSTLSSDVTDAYAKCLIELIADPRSALLLDEMMGSLARAMIDEGVATPSSVATRRSSEALLGSGFLTRLPAPDAEAEEAVAHLIGTVVVPAVDEIREEMSAHGLVRDIAGHWAADARSVALPMIGSVGQAALNTGLERSRRRGDVERRKYSYLYELDSRTDIARR